MLEQYGAIGWDFDGTLIDHEASEWMHDFIQRHPNVRHYIITFRTHGLVETIPHELAEYPNAPPIDAFTDILAINGKLWEAFEAAQWRRRAGSLRGDLSAEEQRYVEWKGETCRRLGIPVLVDDNTGHTRPGCDRYGIDLIHPDQFLT